MLTKYRLFPNLCIHPVNSKHIGVFHALSRQTIYLPAGYLSVLEFLKESNTLNCVYSKFAYLKDMSKVMERLVSAEVVVKADYSYQKKINSIKTRISFNKPKLCMAKFIVTDFCNLSCVYCLFKSGPRQHYQMASMSLETASEAAKFFIRLAYRGHNFTPSVKFTGGEPLLNFNAIRMMTAIIRSHDYKYFPNNPVLISLTTNGTLITKSIARFLVKSGIQVSISLDGVESIHNQKRRDHSRSGSFKEASRGYKILQAEGAEPAILCTVGRHNMHSLPEIAEYFSHAHGAKVVGFNLMFDIPGKTHLSITDMDCVSVSLIKAFEILRDRKVYEVTIGRLFDSVGNLKFRFYACSGCGDEIVISPNGDFGPCPVWHRKQKYFFGNIYKNKTKDIFDHPVLRLWRKHTSFNIPDCLYCPAIAICAGGCAYHSELKNGQFLGKDERYCKLYSYFLPWYIEDRYRRGQALNVEFI